MSEQLTLFAPIQPPPKAIADEMLEREFEEFWCAYPSRSNNPKATARASYRRARKTATYKEIMAGLERYEFSSDPRTRPMAATWLNQRRWECQRVDLAEDPWGLGALQQRQPDCSGLSAASYERIACA